MSQKRQTISLGSKYATAPLIKDEEEENMDESEMNGEEEDGIDHDSNSDEEGESISRPVKSEQKSNSVTLHMRRENAMENMEDDDSQLSMCHRNMFISVLIVSSTLTIVTLLVLFMNGVLWESHSIPNYQFNMNGIVLTIILYLAGFVLSLYLVVKYLVWTYKGCFDRTKLENITLHYKKVFDINMSKISDEEKLKRAREFFQRSEKMTDDSLMEHWLMEQWLSYVRMKLLEKIPYMGTQNSKWVYSYIGGVTARQTTILMHPCEYLVLWGTTLPQEAFSGVFTELNEGDTVISGTLRSTEPESRLSIPRTYTMGKTSRLRNNKRKHYTMSKNCYMISFALKKNTSMLSTMGVGLLWPYFFQNYDFYSFHWQLRDFTIGSLNWMKYRMMGGGNY